MDETKKQKREELLRRLDATEDLLGTPKENPDVPLPPPPKVETFQFCPKCGQKANAGSKFCPECGYNLQAPAPQEQRYRQFGSRGRITSLWRNRPVLLISAFLGIIVIASIIIIAAIVIAQNSPAAKEAAVEE